MTPKTWVETTYLDLDSVFSQMLSLFLWRQRLWVLAGRSTQRSGYAYIPLSNGYRRALSLQIC